MSPFWCQRDHLSEPNPLASEQQSAMFEAADFEVSIDISDGEQCDVVEAIELADSVSSEHCEVQPGTLEATEPADTESHGSEASETHEPEDTEAPRLASSPSPTTHEPTETCESTECRESSETREPTECKESSETSESTEYKGNPNVFERRLRRARSSVNLVEEPSLDEVCKGKPMVFGAWTEPPEKKRLVLVDTFETPGKSDLRGRPARQVREWVRLSSTCSSVRGYWGV